MVTHNVAIIVDDYVKPWAVVERETIEQALLHCRGNMTRAAKALGIGRSTLYRKLDSYLEEPLDNKEVPQ